MKGNTTIKFNQSTMIEAVQMYLDAQLTGKHIVESVRSVSGGSGYSDGCFDIEIKEPPVDPRANAA